MSRRNKKKHYGFAMEADVKNQNQENQAAEAAETEVKKPSIFAKIKDKASSGAGKAKEVVTNSWVWKNRGKVAFGAGVITTVVGSARLSSKKGGSGSGDVDDEPELFEDPEEEDLDEIEDDFADEEADEDE